MSVGYIQLTQAFRVERLVLTKLHQGYETTHLPYLAIPVHAGFPGLQDRVSEHDHGNRHLRNNQALPL